MKIRCILKESNFNITDDYIKSLYFTKQETINSNYLKSTWLERHPEINDYLVNRYPDSTSYKETLYRILLGIEKRPVCKTCGKPVMFEAGHRWGRGRNGWPFLLYCSPKCQANDPEIKSKHIQTYLDKYGVVNPAKNKEVKEKIRQTNLEKYGVENVYQSSYVKDKLKKHNLEKYGVEYNLSAPEIREKIKKTCYKKYNAPAPAGSEEVQKKINLSKKNNGTFNTSAPEEKLYIILSSLYDNVKRQYFSNEYKHACDFYIPELDLYIEYQGSWTHHIHPYNEKDENDILEKMFMEHKSEYSNFYKTALNVWTKKDVQKRNEAIENNLNYLEIYPYIDLNDIPDIIKDNYSENTIGNHLIVGTK